MSEATPTENRQRFLWAAVATALIYLGLWLFYSNSALAQAQFHLFLPDFKHGGFLALDISFKHVVIVPVTLALLSLYWCCYRPVKSGDVPAAWLFISGLLLAVLAVLVPNFHSTDLFGYINRGWEQVHYGLNPYVYTIDHIPGWEQDPMITDHWVNNPSPYGFLYLIIARTLTLLGGGSLPQTVAVFKAFNLLIHAGTAGLIWQSTRHLQRAHAESLAVDNNNAESQSPADRAPDSQSPAAKFNPSCALYLYLFNPLVLTQSLSNGHNDIIMGFFVLLSAWATLAGAWLWMLPTLMAATLIKYGAVVILPPALLFLIKQKAWTALAGGLLLGTLVFGLCGWPYLGQWEQFHLEEIGANAFVSHGSLHSLVYSAYKTIGKELIPAWYDNRETVRAALKNTLLLGYASFYAWLGWQRLRTTTYAPLAWVRDALLLMVLLICLVSLKFYPWYLGMFFPLALLLPEGDWLRRLVLLLSCAQLLSITFIGQAHLLNFILETALPAGFIAWQERKRHSVETQLESRRVEA